MKKEQQQQTLSTLVVAPTEEVTHASFHSSEPIMDDTPIQENPEEHPTDMIVHPEKTNVDLDTRFIKREIS